MLTQDEFSVFKETQELTPASRYPVINLHESPLHALQFGLWLCKFQKEATTGQELQDIYMIGFKPDFNLNFNAVAHGHIKYFSRYNVDVTIAIGDSSFIGQQGRLQNLGFKNATHTTGMVDQGALHEGLQSAGLLRPPQVSRRPPWCSTTKQGTPARTTNAKRTTSAKDFKKMIFHSTSQSSTLHFTDKDFMCKAMKERSYNFNVKTFKLCNWCMEDFNSNDCKHQVKSDLKK